MNLERILIALEYFALFGAVLLSLAVLANLLRSCTSP